MACRYDYEECALEPCNAMMEKLEKRITDVSFIGKEFSFNGKTYKVKVADNFSYTDPVDKSVSQKQVRHGSIKYVIIFNSHLFKLGSSHCF